MRLMGDPEVEVEIPTADDRAYRYVVRSLYVVGLALNVWLIYEMVKDQPEFAIEVERWKAWWRRHVTNCEGCAKRKAAMKAMGNRLVYETQEFLEQHHES
jgi:hypothetical protein